MTAELSTAMPEAGGYIVWIHRAFGDFWAMQASVWTVVSPHALPGMFRALFCVLKNMFLKNGRASRGRAGGRGR